MSVELSDEQFKIMNGAKTLLDQLMAHPKARGVAEQAIKTVHPNAITTADRVAPFVQAIQNLNGKIEGLEKKQKDKEIEDRLNSGFEVLRTRRHFTDDGIEKVKEFMVKEGIANPLVAADAWERRNPKAEPQTPGFSSAWNFDAMYGDEAMDKLLWTNPDRFAEQETAAVLKEFARGNEDY